MLITALRNHIHLWVMLECVLGGPSYHKPNGGERHYLLPGTAAAHTWHWTRQTETGYPESWNPAWQFTKHREKMTQRLGSPWGLPRVSASALLPSGCLILTNRLLVMIIYSRFIFSFFLLSKQKNWAKIHISLWQTLFQCEFSQKPVDLLLYG